MGAGVYLSTPKVRSEWERVIPGVVAALGVIVTFDTGILDTTSAEWKVVLASGIAAALKVAAALSGGEE